MKTRELKVARIGNSRGVRLPADTLRRYRVGAVLRMEERVDGILLFPRLAAEDKLSWEDTAREMAANREAWGEWDAVAGDGLASVPWEQPAPTAVAESGSAYCVKPHGRRRRGGKVRGA